jgi:hypothetical protein
MGAPQQQLIMSNSPLESAFHHATKPVHKLNAVRELLDVKVNDPVTHDFSNEGVVDRISRNNVFVDNSKLRTYLRSMGATGSGDADIGSAHVRDKLKKLMGDTKPAGMQAPPKKPPMVKRLSTKTSLVQPSELLMMQLSEMRSKTDALNNELTSVMKQTVESGERLQQATEAGASEEVVVRRKAAISELQSRKQNLMKKLKMLEQDVERKEKELASA